MKVKEFDYVKKDGTKSHRKVMIMNSYDTYIDAIDLDLLSEDEIKNFMAIKEKYESDIKEFTKKSFRRFSKDGIENLKVVDED